MLVPSQNSEDEIQFDQTFASEQIKLRRDVSFW